MLGDHGARLVVKVEHVRGVEHDRVIDREAPLLGGERGRGAIGFALDGPQPATHQLDRPRVAISGTAEEKGVRETRNTEADSPLGFRFGLLVRKRIAGNVDHVV
ncbi:hypothetical protein D9M73_95670 [compost metagenome]